MIIRILTAVIFASISVLSHAQFVGEVANLPPLLPGTNSTRYEIIRSIGEKYSVCYSNESGVHEISIVGFQDYYSAVIPPVPFLISHHSLPTVVSKVYDIRVLDDYIYICGALQSGVGFIASIAIGPPSTLMPSLPTLGNLSLTTIRESISLTRMTVYKSRTGSVKAVAVGVSSISYLNQIVIEVDDFLATGSIGYKYASIPMGEACDVRYTGVYVVLVGSIAPTKELCLRRADMDDVINTQLFDRFQYSYLSGDVYYPPTAISTKDNEMSVAYMHYDESTDNYSTRIRHFIIPTMSNVNSHEVQTGNKQALMELAYVSDMSVVMLLQDMPYPIGGGIYESVFIPIFPSNTFSYTANIRWLPGNILFSQDVTLGKIIISTGFNKMLVHNPTVSLPAGCIQQGSLPVTQVSPLPKTHVYSPLPIRTGISAITSYWLPLSFFPPTSFDCNNP